MTRMWAVAVLGAALALACSGSTRRDDSARRPTDDAGAEKSEGMPTRVHLSEAVVRDANIVTQAVGLEVLASSLVLTGEVAADPDRSAKVASPVAGRLQEVSFKEGTLVKRGDAMAVVRAPELGNLRAAYAATGDRARAARANADRLKELASERLAATQAQLDAEAQAHALELEGRALGQQLATMGAGSKPGASALTVFAPLGGSVLTRDAVVGQAVTTDQTLATISDLAEVLFLARVYEKDLGRIRVGAAAAVEVSAHPAEMFDGHVEYLGQQIDPVSRTFLARVRLRNRGDLLRIGLFGTARVTTAEAAVQRALPVLPRSAVTLIGDQPTVFVLEEGDYVARGVTLGSGVGDRVEARSGIKEGDRVVVRGAFAVKSALLKSTLAAE